MQKQSVKSYIVIPYIKLPTLQDLYFESSEQVHTQDELAVKEGGAAGKARHKIILAVCTLQDSNTRFSITQ